MTPRTKIIRLQAFEALAVALLAPVAVEVLGVPRWFYRVAAACALASIVVIQLLRVAERREPDA
jgi:hypothetical protein